MMKDGISFDVLESLFLMNEGLHKADLYPNEFWITTPPLPPMIN
jgi:hypothetical protein